MKALLELFKQVQQTEEFDAIRIGLASPEKIRSWSYGEVKKRRPSTTAPSSPSATAFSARAFSADQGLRVRLRQVQAPEAPGGVTSTPHFSQITRGASGACIAADALVVLDRPENARAEKAVALGLKVR